MCESKQITCPSLILGFKLKMITDAASFISFYDVKKYNSVEEESKPTKIITLKETPIET